jgi:endonuclease YncB( thermonuclease family)
MKKSVIIILTILALNISLVHADINGRAVRIIDGDTVQVLEGNNLIKVRLAGIDAPESKQAYGSRSKKTLTSLIARKDVSVKGGEIDRYNRLLGTIYVNGEDINAIQIKTGMAWAYRYKGKAVNNQYVILEQQAKKNKVGLWSQTNIIEPWKWREDNK